MMDRKTISIMATLLFFITFPGIIYAGPNSIANCNLDLDIQTYSYVADDPTMDVEDSLHAIVNSMVYVAVVAHNVNNLDTYQVELNFDPEKLEFIAAYEEDPVVMGISNLLKVNGGSTLGFYAAKREPGLINIANTLIGDFTSQAPEGSGIIAIIGFRVLKPGVCRIKLSNVHFINSNTIEDHIVNTKNGIIYAHE